MYKCSNSINLWNMSIVSKCIDMDHAMHYGNSYWGNYCRFQPETFKQHIKLTLRMLGSLCRHVARIIHHTGPYYRYNHLNMPHNMAPLTDYCDLGSIKLGFNGISRSFWSFCSYIRRVSRLIVFTTSSFYNDEMIYFYGFLETTVTEL